MRRIKGYKNMSKERLLNALDESKSAKSLNNAKIERLKRQVFKTNADLECLLEKMQSCQDNFVKSYTEKKTKHALSGYLFYKLFV